MVQIRPIRPDDHPDILALNAAWVHFLAPLDADGLEEMEAIADVACVAEDDGKVVGFIIALGDGKSYESPNYAFFEDRYERFLYIDRIVIHADAQGKGVGNALYEAVFAQARDAHIPLVTCEVDIDPPNDGSLAFHKRMGFVEVGELHIRDASKTVSLQVRQIS